MSRHAFRSLLPAILLCAGLPALGQTQLPDGAGKEIVQTGCLNCHELNRITGTGHSAEDWQTIIHMMMNVGAKLPEDQLGTVAAYLAKNFPEKPNPQTEMIPGPARVSFKEWMVPTPGSRPHDPLAHPDG